MGHIGTDIKQLIMNRLKTKLLKIMNQDNNQDKMSRLLTRSYFQEFCPRSFNLFFFNNLIKTQFFNKALN
jgi:hypothetical protein